MPSSAVLSFTDPDHYAASVRQGSYDLTITARGRFTATLTRIDLRRLWLQRFADNLPRVTRIDGWGRRAVIAFRVGDGSPAARNGIEMRPADIMRHAEGQTYYTRSTGPAGWAAMSLPVEDLAAVAAKMVGCDLTPPASALVHVPPRSAMVALQRLHATAGRLAGEAPEIIANPDAARGLEQALIQAMLACFASGERREDTAALRQHAAIMRRFRQAIEENPDDALYIPELCTAIGVSERTLRACCREQLKLSPKRYLLLRRMHLASRALRTSSPNATTVTAIATRYGFWQLGRFAVEYKALYGEAPSETLAREPE